MATEAHTEVPHEGKGQFPPFNPQTFASQLVWLAIAFVVLYVLMSRLALPRIGKIIDDREATIKGDVAEAEKAKTQFSRLIFQSVSVGTGMRQNSHCELR